MFKNVFGVILLIFSVLPSFSQNDPSRWVDSVFQRLTTEQKIGQLFMIPVSTTLSAAELEELKSLLAHYQPGGLLITHGSVNSHIRTLNALQATSKLPLMTAIQAEWGVGQTLDSAMTFQKPLLLGAIANDSLIHNLGKEIGRQMKLLGLQINLAPNADLDINGESYPKSIEFWGDQKSIVARKTMALMNGLQSEGVLACAKFTPDSYKDAGLPSSTEFFELGSLDSLGLFPLTKLIQNGAKGVLTSHLHFSMQGKKTRVPASVSQLFVSKVLRTQLGFNGLTFCEIPYLQTLTRKRKNGDTEKLAFSIGNDVLIAPQNLKRSIKKIAAAVRKDPALSTQLDASVKKILAFKYESGLVKSRYVHSENINLKIQSAEAQALKHLVAESAVTIVRNKSELIPFKNLDHTHYVSISVGKENQNSFNEYLSRYSPFTRYSIRSTADTSQLSALRQRSVLVVSLFPMASNLRSAITPAIQQLSKNHDVVICNFGDPKLLETFSTIPTLVVSYAEEDFMAEKTAQVLFGGLAGKGQLPLRISEQLPSGISSSTAPIERFAYTAPEHVGMDSRTLEKIKEIVREGIDMEAFPGCQVVVARKGKVVFHHSFGWYTYEKQKAVTDSTIYDLASITKVAATLQGMIFLSDRKLIDVEKKAAVYLPELTTSNKKDITLKDILTHQSGLLPFIPLWPQTFKNNTFDPYYYNSAQSDKYPLQVAPKLFAAPVIRDSAWHWTLKSKMIEKTPRTPYTYRYSDIGSMIMHRLVESAINQPMDEFLSQNLYEPLGAHSLGYLPLSRFSVDQIAPTENDTIFRKQWIVGTVHDERAALLGGVAGHAGLFGNANDLAKLGQMLLNGGRYGGLQFYKPETVFQFTAKQYEDSRRGLGWDKPMPGDWNGPTAFAASPRTYGHTGFTGTCIWIDPEFDLVFVFLSNRVYPDRSHNKISSANLRPRIQEVIYQSIFNYCQYQN